ncbi:MAG: D-aminoacyl-tRNA deacylase, partial [Gemmata sp.]|nr:D-aminoacyl-tRNA deacylase [Gemmata sp.]
GDCQKGRRPSFTGAAPPVVAEPLYEAFLTALRRWGIPVASGRFAADMQVELVNDGPVTFVIDAPV